MESKSLSARASRRYDAIRTTAQLRPDPAHFVRGFVRQPNGEPAVGAEVVLCIDEEDWFTIQNGRLRHSVESVVVRTDDQGHYQHYPPSHTWYRLVALHPHGFGEIFVNDFPSNTEIKLSPWGRVEVAFDEQAESGITHGITTTSYLKEPPKGSNWSNVRIDMRCSAPVATTVVS